MAGTLERVDYAYLPIIIEANSDALNTFADGVATTVGYDAAEVVRRFGESVLINANDNSFIALNPGEEIEELIPSLRHISEGGAVRSLGKYPTLGYAIARRDDGTHCLVMTDSSSGTRATVVFEPYKNGAVTVQDERVSHFDPSKRITHPLTSARRALRPHPTPSPASVQ